jgi:hypothetical protein
MSFGPCQDVVGYLFPSILPESVVCSARIALIFGNGVGFPVQFEIGLNY